MSASCRRCSRHQALRSHHHALLCFEEGGERGLSNIPIFQEKQHGIHVVVIFILQGCLFQEQQHGIHVVVTFILQCCLFVFLDNASEEDLTTTTTTITMCVICVFCISSTSAACKDDDKCSLSTTSSAAGDVDDDDNGHDGSWRQGRTRRNKKGHGWGDRHEEDEKEEDAD